MTTKPANPLPRWRGFNLLEKLSAHQPSQSAPNSNANVPFRDALDILRESGIGFALWNFRGAFGVLDSGRADVVYDDWHGHQLDRKLLELLREC